MEHIVLNLTAQEANDLMQLIDIAVKSAGLDVAENAISLSQKIKAAGEAYNQANLDAGNTPAVPEAKDDTPEQAEQAA